MTPPSPFPSLYAEAASILKDLRALRAREIRHISDKTKRRIRGLQEQYGNNLYDPHLEELIDEIEYLATTMRAKSPMKFNPTKGRV